MQKSFNRVFCFRAVICFILCLILAVLAVVRIFVINLNVNEKTANTPYNSVSFNFGSTRGNIYDTHGFLLTNELEEYKAIIAPTQNAIRRLNTFYSLEEKRNILERLKGNKPILVNANTHINIDDIYGFSYTNRYTDNTLARHLIGYVNAENNGVCGIEKSYNDILYSAESFTVSLSTNAKGQVLKGEGLKFYGKQNNNAVFLTIDKRIQKIAEDCAKQLNKGAIIICETNSGKIRAMVSKPNFNQNNVAESLNDNSSPLVNRALQSYNVGSVFKPCVAIAAIKCNLQNYEYTCTGSCDIDGYKFNCHKKEGHGKMNLKTAIANSCNTYFYNISQEIDKEVLYNTAVSLGFSSFIKIANNLKSDVGNISTKKELNSSKRLVANFSIGQGNILLSPLLMLNLYNTIANNGEYTKPYVVEKTVVNEKSESFNSSTIKVINKAESDILKDALLSVVEDGTGKLAKSQEILLAGKTATAETGWLIDGKKAVHSWFCGFFPYYNPKYTTIVFAENSDVTNSSTAEIFKNIAEEMKNQGLTT